MKIGFIGAGKVGFSLGKYFVDRGIYVIGYYSQHEESAEDAAHFTNTKAYRTPSELIADSDAIFITVPDTVIGTVYAQVKNMITNKIICHCSGAMTAEEAFPHHADCGARGYSIHPLFPVSSKYDAHQGLTDAFFAWKETRRT